MTVLERTNARALDAGDAAVRARSRRRRRLVHLADEGPAGGARVRRASAFDVLAMVKPQFEVGREQRRQGRRRARAGATRREALVAVATAARAAARPCSGSRRRACRGPRATSRRFVWLAEAGRAGDVEDLDAAAREVEP